MVSIGHAETGDRGIQSQAQIPAVLHLLGLNLGFTQVQTAGPIHTVDESFVALGEFGPGNRQRGQDQEHEPHSETDAALVSRMRAGRPATS